MREDEIPLGLPEELATLPGTPFAMNRAQKRANKSKSKAGRLQKRWQR